MSTLNVNCTCSVLFNWGYFIMYNALYHFGSRWYSLHVALSAFIFPHPPHHWSFNSQFHTLARRHFSIMHPIRLMHPSAFIQLNSNMFRVISNIHSRFRCLRTFLARCPFAFEHPSHPPSGLLRTLIEKQWG